MPPGLHPAGGGSLLSWWLAAGRTIRVNGLYIRQNALDLALSDLNKKERLVKQRKGQWALLEAVC